MVVPKLRFKADDGSDYPEWNNFTKLEDISAFITKGGKLSSKNAVQIRLNVFKCT